MPGLAQSITQTLRKLWLTATGQDAPAMPEVIVHDPAALRAHDLDDPFFDDNVQTRIGGVIAGAGHKK